MTTAPLRRSTCGNCGAIQNELLFLPLTIFGSNFQHNYATSYLKISLVKGVEILGKLRSEKVTLLRLGNTKRKKRNQRMISSMRETRDSIQYQNFKNNCSYTIKICKPQFYSSGLNPKSTVSPPLRFHFYHRSTEPLL